MDVIAEIGRLIPRRAKTLLDVGCGGTAKVRKVCGRRKIDILGIDVMDDAVARARRNKLNAFTLDMRRMQIFAENAFDAVLFMDSLEHVKYRHGIVAVLDAKRICRLSVVAFVPLGDVGWNEKDEGPMRHKHKWSAEELEDLGFTLKVIKHRKGEAALCKYTKAVK